MYGTVKEGNTHLGISPFILKSSTDRMKNMTTGGNGASDI
jgi:hypothetical protein